MVAIITALLFGLVPAVSASRATLNQTLGSSTTHVAGSIRQSFARRALVVGELVIALVFLTGAGLVVKTFWRATRVDPGFHAQQVLNAKFPRTMRQALGVIAALLTGGWTERC